MIVDSRAWIAAAQAKRSGRFATTVSSTAVLVATSVAFRGWILVAACVALVIFCIGAIWVWLFTKPKRSEDGLGHFVTTPAESIRIGGAELPPDPRFKTPPVVGSGGRLYVSRTSLKFVGPERKFEITRDHVATIETLSGGPLSRGGYLLITFTDGHTLPVKAYMVRPLESELRSAEWL